MLVRSTRSQFRFLVQSAATTQVWSDCHSVISLRKPSRASIRLILPPSGSVHGANGGPEGAHGFGISTRVLEWRWGEFPRATNQRRCVFQARVVRFHTEGSHGIDTTGRLPCSSAEPQPPVPLVWLPGPLPHPRWPFSCRAAVAKDNTSHTEQTKPRGNEVCVPKRRQGGRDQDVQFQMSGQRDRLLHRIYWCENMLADVGNIYFRSRWCRVTSVIW